MSAFVTKYWSVIAWFLATGFACVYSYATVQADIVALNRRILTTETELVELRKQVAGLLDITTRIDERVRYIYTENGGKVK